MKSNNRDVLEQLEPKGLGPEGPKWQQRKSSQTRTAILEATIDSLERHGYAQTTMQQIAELAKISRGAMTHHYVSKQELISAVIDYLFYKRMELFLGRIATLSDSERVEQNLGIERAWEAYFTREYRAYLELGVAAQTDKELSEIFLPKARRYDRIWRAETLKVFPEWRDKLELLEHATDLLQALFEGMMLNRRIWNSPEREAMLRAFLAYVVRRLRDGELKLPSKKEAAKFRGPPETRRGLAAR
jgi:AcrR family transcriptional regulator